MCTGNSTSAHARTPSPAEQQAVAKRVESGEQSEAEHNDAKPDESREVAGAAGRADAPEKESPAHVPTDGGPLKTQQPGGQKLPNGDDPSQPQQTQQTQETQGAPVRASVKPLRYEGPVWSFLAVSGFD